jgi:hypothetical protein
LTALVRRADLSPDAIEKIKRHRYDRIIEKHEGPERWSDVLEYDDPDSSRSPAVTSCCRSVESTIRTSRCCGVLSATAARS